MPLASTSSHAISVSSLYNFEGAGEGDFSFEPVTWFQVPDIAASKVKSIGDFSKVEVQSNSAKVSISGDIARRELKLNKRAKDTCDDSTKKDFIDSAYVFLFTTYQSR